jgi:hypothetical protein
MRNSCRLLPLLFMIVFILQLSSGKALCSEGLTAGVRFDFEGAVNTRDMEAQKLELRIEPELEAGAPYSWDLKTIARLRVDALDKLDPGRPDQGEISSYSRRVMIGDRADLELRELYGQRSFGNIFIRAGKQQIVWGQADGLKVLDVVDPQDFREFILDDFKDSRIPLWSVDLEFPVKAVTVQLIWVPDRTYDDIPEADAAYAFTAPELVPSPPAGIATVIHRSERPGRFFADSDAGFRLSTFWRGWDIAFMYFYHYSDIPVLFQSFSVQSGMPTVTVDPAYRRNSMTGLSFSNAFGDFTLRGETAYFSDRYSIADLNDDPDGIVRTGEASYVIGVDWQGLAETFLSVQFFQSILTERPEGLVRDPVESTITFFVKRDYINATLTPQLMWMHNLNFNDGLLRPKISYEVMDNVRIWAGGDIFYGSSRGIFGQFDRNDRIVFGAEIGM